MFHVKLKCLGSGLYVKETVRSLLGLVVHLYIIRKKDGHRPDKLTILPRWVKELGNNHAISQNSVSRTVQWDLVMTERTLGS